MLPVDSDAPGRHLPSPYDVKGEQQSCDQKARLLKRYNEATTAFAAAVAELQGKMATTPKSEYDRLRRISEEERSASDQARLALERHIAAHGC